MNKAGGLDEAAINLSLLQRLQLRLRGFCFLRYEKRDGWKGYLPIYIVECKEHGLFTDYPHGYSEYFLCPKCMEQVRENLRFIQNRRE